MKTILFSLLLTITSQAALASDGPSNSVALSAKQKKAIISILNEIKACPLEAGFPLIERFDNDACVLPAAEAASLALKAIYGENDPAAQIILGLNKCVVDFDGKGWMVMNNDCYKPIVNVAINLVKTRE